MENIVPAAQSYRCNLGSDERFLINKIANGTDPAKELQVIINREGTASPTGQYAQLLLNIMPETIQEIQPIGNMKVFPVMITARNEEISLPRTVKTLIDSAMNFQKTHADFHVAILLSNNASTDETTAAVAQVYQENKKELINHHISIEVVYEGRPGKTNGIKKGLKHLKKRFAGKYTHVLSSDADVEWETGAILAIWERANPKTGVRPLLVGSNITPRNRKNLWGFLEDVVYYGYGSLPPRNQGIFMKFISGMGYLADESVLHHLENLPEEIGLDDVAISTLVGPENIAIASDAIVRYDMSDDWDTFVKIRGRHVREILRIAGWLTKKYGEKKGEGMVSAIAQLCTVTITDGYFKPIAPLESLDGSFRQKVEKFIKIIKSVPVLNYPYMQVPLGFSLMPIVYPYLTYKGMRQVFKVSWWIALMGLAKQAIGIPYVTFLQNRESTKEEKTQMVTVPESSLWDPSEQRKIEEPEKQKGFLFTIRDFLSNNLNWAYAIIFAIEALILGVVLKLIFISFSEIISLVATKMSSNSSMVSAYATQLSQTTSFIGQHILSSFIVMCLIIYVCLFFFSIVQSIGGKDSFVRKLVDSFKSTNSKFITIVAFPFRFFEKIILYLTVIPLTFVRLFFKKMTSSTNNTSGSSS